VKYLFDTNICIALLKKNEPQLIEKIKSYEPSDFALCSIVKAELLFGARKSQQIEKNILLLNNFFSSFHSFSFDDSASEYYGINRMILEKSGEPIGEADLLISSIALSNNLTVLTRNRKEFIRVPGLKVDTW
jgi:tRNA(fMet)-specific endonuclease VapC